MQARLIWDETKRATNLVKHGLDFAAVRDGEARVQSISYALGFLAVLTIVHTQRDVATRIISFRRASSKERDVYDAWLQNE